MTKRFDGLIQQCMRMSCVYEIDWKWEEEIQFWIDLEFLDIQILLVHFFIEFSYLWVKMNAQKNSVSTAIVHVHSVFCRKPNPEVQKCRFNKFPEVPPQQSDNVDDLNYIMLYISKDSSLSVTNGIQKWKFAMIVFVFLYSIFYQIMSVNYKQLW